MISGIQQNAKSINGRGSTVRLRERRALSFKSSILCVVELEADIEDRSQTFASGTL